MKAVFVSFDLGRADSRHYLLAYDILGQFGLRPTALNDETVRLPNTTAMGLVPDDVTSLDVVNTVKGQFALAGLDLTNVFCGVVDGNDWSVQSAV